MDLTSPDDPSLNLSADLQGRRGESSYFGRFMDLRNVHASHDSIRQSHEYTQRFDGFNLRCHKVPNLIFVIITSVLRRAAYAFFRWELIICESSSTQMFTAWVRYGHGYIMTHGQLFGFEMEHFVEVAGCGNHGQVTGVAQWDYGKVFVHVLDCCGVLGVFL